MSLNPKNYNDTVNYLYSLQKHGIKLGLTNIKKLMAILKEPQISFHSIHIAGTNGKGSTAAIMASILIENGFKVGLYTSPHLLSFTERIKVDNRQISEEEVIEFASYIRNIIDKTDIKPTFFEFVTAMAFYYFAIRDVDWAVIETGMGGRFDATNVILPDISIITNVTIDHVEFLGKSISEIAIEKAGIIKQGVPVITASSSHDAINQLSKAANRLASAIHIYGKDFRSTPLLVNDREIKFDYTGYKNYSNLTLPLPGRHQLYNASLAIRACEILMEKEVAISDASINNGVAKVSLEGRFERISQTPPIILDSAHNPEAAKSLADAVKELLRGKNIIFIIGIMKDKDTVGILKPLIQIATSIILTKPKGDRAASPEKLNDDINRLRSACINNKSLEVTITSNVAEAVAIAKRQLQEDSIILVTGSFYTTGEVKELLGCAGVMSHLRE